MVDRGYCSRCGYLKDIGYERGRTWFCIRQGIGLESIDFARLCSYFATPEQIEEDVIANRSW